MTNTLKSSKMTGLNKKLRKKFNWIVRKINGPQQQATTTTTTGTTCNAMPPAISKEKISAAVALNENDFNELNVKEFTTTTTTTNTNTTTTAETDATAMTTTVTAMAPTTSTPLITTLQQQQQQTQSTQQQQRQHMSNGVCGCGNAAATNTTSGLNRNRQTTTATTQNGQTSPRGDTMTQQQQQQQQSSSSSHSTCCRGARSKLSQLRATATANATATSTSTATLTTLCTGSTTPPMKRSADDYVFGRYIGEGSFSSVYLAQDIYTKRDYAIKVCDKRHILREQKQEYVRREREIMHLMTNVPGFVNLSCTFQDNRSLFFVMTFAQNGDMLPHINKVGSFDVECTRHYAAEIVLACEQMHRRNIVHRDLKPENILLDEEMHTLIADFGSAKLLTSSDPNTAAAATATATAEEAAVPSNTEINDALTSSISSSSESASSNERQQQPHNHHIQHTEEKKSDNESRDGDGDASAKRHNGARKDQRRAAENGSAASNDDEDDDDDDVDDDEEDDDSANDENAGTPSQRRRYRRKRKASFVGTAQYVSPEVLQNIPVTPSADLWALGCIIYQMISGLPPFRGSNDYVIFKEILACELDFPAGFDKDAEDLVRKLIKINPEERLGALDDFSEGIYTSIRSHPFFDGIDFDTVRDNEPPKIYPYLPIEELRSKYSVPDNLKPGLDKQQLTRLIGMELGTALVYEIIVNNKTNQKDEFDMTDYEKRERLEKQKSDKWHAFAENEVIFKKGFVNKRKGLFARKRMLLLTSGPRLIYIDPVQMVKKGEIPWSPELRVEPKNFKIFFVHTPNRTYYLEEPEGFALEWVDAIERMRKFVYRETIDPAELTYTTTPNSYVTTTTATPAVMTTATSYIHTTRSTSSSTSSSSRQNSKLISS